jgi:RNA polymerase sigma factor (sigma-70 family)
VTEGQITMLFREHYRRAVRFLMGRGEDFDSAEDMVQMAFARMALSNVETAMPVAYLFRACRNRQVDAARLRAYEREPLVRYRAECPRPETPEEAVIAAEDGERDAARIAAALAPLSQRERRLLRAWSDVPQRFPQVDVARSNACRRERKLLLAWSEAPQRGKYELAAISGLSPKSIGTTLKRLLDKVRGVA